MIDLLFSKTWWRYRPGEITWIYAPYHVFNLFEGCAWFVFGALVLNRYWKHHHSSLELWYALAFFTFGLTDFREAYVLNSWLIWLKLANLVFLFRLRSLVIKRYYPSSKLY